MPIGLSRRALWHHKLAEEVARGLGERIASGALARGAPLPDRDQIAAEFVTSPGVVDRAIEMLAAEGLVSAGPQGHMTIAGAPPRNRSFELPEDIGATRQDVIAILELRMGVEVMAAALAAQRRTDTSVAALRAAAADYAQAVADRAGMAQADFRLHRAVAEASANPYILDLLDYLGPLLIPRMRSALPMPAEGQAAEANLAASLAEHAALVEAIAQGNADAARQAMRTHLARSLRFIQETAAAD